VESSARNGIFAMRRCLPLLPCLPRRARSSSWARAEGRSNACWILQRSSQPPRGYEAPWTWTRTTGPGLSSTRQDWGWSLGDLRTRLHHQTRPQYSQLSCPPPSGFLFHLDLRKITPNLRVIPRSAPSPGPPRRDSFSRQPDSPSTDPRVPSLIPRPAYNRPSAIAPAGCRLTPNLRGKSAAEGAAGARPLFDAKPGSWSCGTMACVALSATTRAGLDLLCLT
jgi:hypothetical protein